jgi:hypothetical protein
MPELEKVKTDFESLSYEYSAKHAELLGMLQSSQKEIYGLSKDREKLEIEFKML